MRSETGSTSSRAAGGSRLALVTGATGFVGSRVVRRLRADGWQVRAIVRTHDPSHDLDGVEQIVGDFVDSTTSRAAAAGANVVVHCAATAGPDRETAFHVNVAGTRSMLDAAIEQGVERFVQISTCSVYRTEGLPIVDEDAPLQGADAEPYGATKAEADLEVLERVAAGLRATILRPGAIQGVHPTSTWAVKVPDRIRTDTGGPPRSRARTMPWVHVEDLVDAVLLAFSSEMGAGRVYNMVDEHNTWGEYADRVRSWFDMGPLQEPEGAPPAWTGRFDARRVRAELGYVPRRTYAQGMNEAEQYWRERLVSTGSV